MSDSPDKNAAMIDGLLNALADLSGDEAAVESYRRQADLFELSVSTARIALEIHAPENDREGRREARGCLERLQELFQAQGEYPAAGMISEGLRIFDEAERRP